MFLPGEQLVLNASTLKVTGTRFINLPGGGQAVRTGSGTNYGYEIATDQHGTSTLELDDTAQVPTWRQFTPYGAPRGSTPMTWPDQNGFLDAPADSVDGLTAIGAREYDPTIGQFISLDPQLDTTDPLSLNGYSYTDDNPVDQSDPTGQRVDDTIPGLNAFVNSNDPTRQYYAAQSTKRWLAQAATRAWWRAYNHRIYLVQQRIVAAHAALVAVQRARARAAAARKKQAAKRSFLRLVLDNAEAIAADVAAAAVQPIPGLDAAADIGAGYLDKKAVTGDMEYLSSNDDPDNAAASVSDTCNGSNSFQGTTPVLMADGSSKSIDQVHVGDIIANGQPGTLIGTIDQHHKVTAVHVTRDDKAYTDVTVSAGHGAATIVGTASHLYWDATIRSWVPAFQLRIGDHLQSTDAKPATVVGLRDYTTSMVTYNLTIDNLHMYYVEGGGTPVLVHNEGECGVWSDIKATQPNYPGTLLPKSFELTAGGTKVWVAGNASEHIAERLSGIAKRSSQAQVDLATQVQLMGLQAAVAKATENGVVYDQVINVEGWELIIKPPRQAGQLPSITHALSR